MAARQKYDWQLLRKIFVSGDCTLESLSKESTNLPSSPSLQSVKRHSAEEGWGEQRKAYQRQLASQVAANADVSPSPQQVMRKSEELIDAAEAIARHIGLARVLQSLAYQKLKNIDPANLSVKDAIALIQLGTDLERKALALYEPPQQAQIEVELNFEALTTGELEMVKQAISRTLPNTNN